MSISFDEDIFFEFKKLKNVSTYVNSVVKKDLGSETYFVCKCGAAFYKRALINNNFKCINCNKSLKIKETLDEA